MTLRKPSSTRPTGTRKSPGRRPSFRTSIERLEPRIVLSTINWTGGGDGTSFSNASNWNPKAVPGSSDDAVINISGKPTIQLSFGGISVKSLSVTNATLNLSSGTLSTTNGLTTNNATFNFSGGTINGTTNFSSSTINLTGGAGAAQIIVTNSSFLSGPISSNQTVLVQTDTSTYAPAQLTLKAGVTNAGTIELQGTGNGTYRNESSTLVIAAGSTFTNTGTIQADAFANLAEYLTGNVINDGVVRVQNAATLQVNLNQSGNTFTQRSGTLDGVGRFDVEGGSFVVAGGSVGGAYINGATLTISSSVTTPTTVYAVGSSMLASNASAAGTVIIQTDTSSYNPAQLTLKSGATNAGTIELQGTGNGTYRNESSSLIIAAGSTFTNTGTIQADTFANLADILTGNVINDGVVRVQNAATLQVNLNQSGNTFTQRSGTLDGVGRFEVEGGSFVVAGGSVGGAYVNGATLTIASSVTTPTTVYAVGSSMLASNASAAGTVIVQTNTSAYDPATLTLAPGATNAGTIQLLNVGNGTYRNEASSLVVASGSTFTNAGTIQAGPAIASISISGNVINSGVLNVNQATLAVSGSGSTLDNVLGGVINASGTIDDATSSFTNEGTLNVGPGAATLTITGAYIQSPTGTLGIPIGGKTAGTLFSQLVVKGEAILHGTLATSLINFFTPGLGDKFQVLKYASATGTFDTYAGANLPNGLMFQPSQTPTSLTLNTIAEPVLDASVQMSVPAGPYQVGDILTYTVLVTNNGPVTAYGVVLTDTLPTGTGTPQLQTSNGTIAIAGGIATVSVGTLGVGATATLTVRVQTRTSGQFTNLASVAGAFSDPNPGNDSDSKSVNVAPVPTPGPPTLVPSSNTGTNKALNYTSITSPAFSIATTEPATTTVQLLRSTSFNGTYILVASSQAGTNPVQLVDLVLGQAALQGNVNGVYFYETVLVNQAGYFSSYSTPVQVTILTSLPPAPDAPTLEAASDNGFSNSDRITNAVNPVFDDTGLAANGQLRLYRSINGSTPIRVGIASGLGNGPVPDRAGARPDGVYTYYAAQVDLAGNISPLSAGVVVTIQTQAPPTPTLQLLAADNTGLAIGRPNVTTVNSPRFVGQGTIGDRLDIINAATGSIQASAVLTASGYLLQITGPIADGTYTLQARTVDLAGNFSLSLPVTITIKATPPRIVPVLSISPLDDTGIPGDGVTSNRQPRLVGKTEPGNTVALYSVVNGQTSPSPIATTSLTTDGSFSIPYPYYLLDSSLQVVAQVTDVAGTRGAFGPVFGFRIATVAGDYYNKGYAQFTVFRPTDSGTTQSPHKDAETYLLAGIGQKQVDTTPGRDIPIQFDFNVDGQTDLVGYRFNTASYHGTLSNTKPIDQQFGAGGLSLPVPGNYAGDGTLITADYRPNTGQWLVALPTPGGLVLNLGVPEIDIPTPAAFDGKGQTEIAVFRPTYVKGGDADSFSVRTSSGPIYQVSFTNPVVQKLGFAFKPGDIPAPADYDGVGHDEFAIYRPSTGQFFILNTPNPLQPSTWTLRIVMMTNLTNGPSASDVPASLDYDGDGKADPTVYRPSISTFFYAKSSTGAQLTLPFGIPGDVAAAGPLLYRLSALRGNYASTDGYPRSAVTPSPARFAAISKTTSASVSLAVTRPVVPVTLLPMTDPAPTTSAIQAGPKPVILLGVATPSTTTARAWSILGGLRSIRTTDRPAQLGLARVASDPGPS